MEKKTTEVYSLGNMDAESLERCYRISFPLKTLRENPLLLFLLLMSPGIPWLPAASLLVFLHLCDLLAVCLLASVSPTSCVSVCQLCAGLQNQMIHIMLTQPQLQPVAKFQ